MASIAYGGGGGSHPVPSSCGVGRSLGGTGELLGPAVPMNTAPVSIRTTRPALAAAYGNVMMICCRSPTPARSRLPEGVEAEPPQSITRAWAADGAIKAKTIAVKAKTRTVAVVTAA